MAGRQEWKFRFTAKEVAEAVHRKVVHHASRLEFWQGEAELAEVKMRSEGIKLTAQPVTGGHRLQALIDPTIGQRMEECRSKIQEHERKREEYAAYLRAAQIAVEQGELLTVDVDDIRFFGL